MGIAPSVETSVEFLLHDGKQEDTLKKYWDDMCQLCNINEDLRIHREWEENPASSSGLVDGIEVRLEWTEEVKEKESARLEKQLAKLEQDVQRRQGKLSNEQFISKAPAQVVDRERAALASAEEELALLRRKAESLRASA